MQSLQDFKKYFQGWDDYTQTICFYTLFQLSNFQQNQKKPSFFQYKLWYVECLICVLFLKEKMIKNSHE